MCGWRKSANIRHGAVKSAPRGRVRSRAFAAERYNRSSKCTLFPGADPLRGGSGVGLPKRIRRAAVRVGGVVLS